MKRAEGDGSEGRNIRPATSRSRVDIVPPANTPDDARRYGREKQEDAKHRQPPPATKAVFQRIPENRLH